MKQCSKCKVEKELSSFYKDFNHKDKLSSACRKCHYEMVKRWRYENIPEFRDISKKLQAKYRKQNPQHYKEYNKKWKERNVERNKTVIKRSRLRIKGIVFNHYGGDKPSCICCKENNIHFLTIDHINNDGKVHRKTKGLPSGTGFYYWIVKNNFPKDLQILCVNCNLGKYWNKGICPHKLKNN